MSRSVSFPPDGKRIRVTPAQVMAAWRSATQIIPAQFAVGTATHESDFTINEVDTEPLRPGQSKPFVSKGIFQLSDDEAAKAGMSGANLLLLDVSVKVFCWHATRYMTQIVQAAKLDLTCPPVDVFAYMVIAHNQGLGACLKTIDKHGLDWKAYKLRNPTIKGIAEYGDDCITGGPDWPAQLNA